MSTKHIFKRSVSDGAGREQPPGIFDIRGMSRPRSDVLAELDSGAALRALRERFDIKPHCRQFASNSTPDMELYEELCTKVVEGTVIISDRRVEFTATLGSFVILVEWMELTAKKLTAEQLARRAAEVAASYGESADGSEDDADPPADDTSDDPWDNEYAGMPSHDDDPDSDPGPDAELPNRAPRRHQPESAFDDDPW